MASQVVVLHANRHQLCGPLDTTMSLSSVPSPGNNSFVHPQILMVELQKLKRLLPAVRDDRQVSQEKQTLLQTLVGGNTPQLTEDFCSTWTTLQRWLGFFGAPKTRSFLEVPTVNQSVESVERWIQDSETGLLEFMRMYPGKCIRRVDRWKGESVAEDLECNIPGHRGKLIHGNHVLAQPRLQY